MQSSLYYFQNLFKRRIRSKRGQCELLTMSFLMEFYHQQWRCQGNSILFFFFSLCINFLFWKRKSKVHWLLKLYACTYIYRYRHRFPGGPVVRTPCSHCWGPGFNPLVGEQRSCNVTEKNKHPQICSPLNLKKEKKIKEGLPWLRLYTSEAHSLPLHGT